MKHPHHGSDFDIVGKECLGNLQIQPPLQETPQVVSLEHQLVT